MTGLLLIRDLAVVLLIAGGVAWLCQRLGLSAVVGYLLAGMIIGPHTPPFALVADLDRVQTLAQVGLVFLIFSIGLNLSISRLKRLGLPVVIATVVGAVIVLIGGRLSGWAMGWGGTGGLFLAAMLMVSSSAIIGKVLDELNLAHERAGQLALGVTVLEDVVAITMLTLLTSLVRFGGDAPPALAPALGTLAAFIALVALLSLLVVPGLLARVSRDGQPEIRTLLVGGLLLSLAWLAARAGYSLALGAFLFGAIVGSTRYRADIQRAFEGLGQTFGAVFFVAIGMLVDLRLFMEAWPLALGVAALALLLRPMACSLGFLVVGNTTRESLRAGLTLTPLGEFSFIIAQLGVSSGHLPQAAYPVAVGASLLTALASPILARRAEGLSQYIARAEPPRLRQWLGLYHDWLGRLRQTQPHGSLWRLTGKRFLQIGLYVLAVSALLLLAEPIYARTVAHLGHPRVPPRALQVMFWGAFGLVLLGPLIAIWRNTAALAMILSEAATPGPPPRGPARRLLELAIRGAALAAFAAWLLALLPSPFLSPGAIAAFGVALAIIATLFWRRLVHLQSLLEIQLRDEFARASHATSTSAWPSTLPQQSADWNLDIDEITLPGDSAHAGKTLGQLAARARFGCSVVGIDRQGYGIVNPSADTVLFPHDRLLLLGDADQLTRAARELLAGSAATDSPTSFDELTMETLTVPAGSPLAGKTFIELDLIRTIGIQIGAIRRGPGHQILPRGQDHFDDGDELLVLGTPAQISAFAALLSPRPTAPGDPPH
ncbi:MAG: cation:proton antiporter [Verrucomicrobiae bacterium]|nr:cation:proton antiporter [Verrucomicrobiae bacterium]